MTGESGPGANGVPEHEEFEDSTIVVTQHDATIAVPATDHTVVVTNAERENYDHTVVVTNAERTNNDHTVVVTNAERAVNDHTVAVAKGEPLDATVIASSGAGDDPGASAPRASGRTWTGSKPNTGGAPVEELEEIPSSLARLFFKAPLDPKRRAPESPFPKDQSSLPRGGVRAGMPVVYGTRPEELPDMPEDTDFSKWIGPPPAGHDVGVADRSTLVSTERFNRKFQRIALFGSAGVIAIVAVGLWWVLDSLF